MIEIGNWYWITVGSKIKFFKCYGIVSKSSGLVLYESALWITQSDKIITSDIGWSISSTADDEYIIPISTTDILNYFLDGEMPPIYC